jgi:hypothetical protein
MRELPTLTNQDVEELLTGHAPASEGLADLAQLLGDLRVAVDTAPLPTVGTSLAAFLDGAHETAAVPALAPAKSRRTLMAAVKQAWSKLAGKLVVGLAGLIVLGTAGTAGALPSSLQHAMSRAADDIGIQIPDDSAHTAAHDATEHPTPEVEPADEAEHQVPEVEAAHEADEHPVPGHAATPATPATPASASTENQHNGGTNSGSGSTSSNKGPGSSNSDRNAQAPEVEHQQPEVEHQVPEVEHQNETTSTTVDISHKPAQAGGGGGGGTSGKPSGKSSS